jgi:uncharacterized repeat protein (TIGR01451 family)
MTTEIDAIASGRWLVSASRLRHVVFIGFATSLVALFAMTAVVALPQARPAAAQASPAVAVTLTSSAAKAKVGDLVSFTVLVENTGAESIPDMLINLNLPDALNARAINCPGETFGSTTFCVISDFPAGSLVEILFVAEVGSRELNGPVSASVSSSSIVLATASVPALKIPGSKKS